MFQALAVDKTSYCVCATYMPAVITLYFSFIYLCFYHNLCCHILFIKISVEGCEFYCLHVLSPGHLDIPDLKSGHMIPIEIRRLHSTTTTC